jgi:hypothetical protein
LGILLFVVTRWIGKMMEFDEIRLFWVRSVVPPYSFVGIGRGVESDLSIADTLDIKIA